jgi:hypothetical protein
MDWLTVAGWLFTIGCVLPLALVGLALLGTFLIVAWEHFTR